MNALPNKERGFRPLISTVQFPVMIQTVSNRIIGNLHTREKRIKDALNATEPFIALTNVQIFDLNGQVELKKSEFLTINRAEIIWVIENKPTSGTLNKTF